MKEYSKSIKTIVSLVLLVLAVVSAISLTYSYFTATASKTGQYTFPSLEARFGYFETALSSFAPATTGFTQQTIQLGVANDATIQRNVPFGVYVIKGNATNQSKNAINALGIQKSSDSCDAYFRFWIDAYIMENTGTNEQPIWTPNKSVNYGTSFSFNSSKDVVTGEDNVVLANAGTNRLATNETYCYKAKITDSDGYAIGSTLTLKENADIALLGEKLQVCLTLQAVQADNEAFSSWWNDERGYYGSWI